jgi:hypothetical protein
MEGSESSTDHSDGLHVAKGQSEETLTGESHLCLFFTEVEVLLVLAAFEFPPERLGRQAGACGSRKQGRQIEMRDNIDMCRSGV